MKAAVLYEFDPSLTNPQFVRYEEVPDPKIEKTTDVIVRIGGAGVCRTDLHIVEGIWRSKVDVQLPYIMGHENAGWVEEVGKGVEGFTVLCSNRHQIRVDDGMASSSFATPSPGKSLTNKNI